MTTPLVLVHGGAGFWPELPEERKNAIVACVRQSCRAGLAAMGDGPIAAVVAATRVLEESGLFNAGKGASLTTDGTVELDAAVMRGEDIAAGAVGAVEKVRWPTDLARDVMEKTDHVLLVGRGAERLARAFGHDDEPWPIDEERRARWKKLMAGGDGSTESKRGPVSERQERVRALLRRYGELAPEGFAGGMTADTVGAVAVDARGRTAASCSTGGIWLKLPGRVGDSPIPGAGLIADDEAGGAVVATGIGEVIMKLCLSQATLARFGPDGSPQAACEGACAEVTRRLGASTVGLIAADREGRIGAALNTAGMPRAVLREGEPEAHVALAAEDPFPRA